MFIKTSDNLSLSGTWDLPNNKTDKAIILAHGITVDKEEDGIFTNLSGYLRNHGFAVFRFDFRGHGQSEGLSVDMTLEGELRDLKAALLEVKSKGYKKIGLLGASFGGGIAALFTARNQNEIKSLCLWNPVLDYDHCFINPTVIWILSRKSHMKKDLLEKGWTTLGSRQFKIGKPLFDEMEKTFPYEELKKIEVPTLIIHGNKDTYVPFEDSESYVKNLSNEKFLAIEGAEHGFHDTEEHAIKANQATLNFFQENL